MTISNNFAESNLLSLLQLILQLCFYDAKRLYLLSSATHYCHLILNKDSKPEKYKKAFSKLGGFSHVFVRKRRRGKKITKDKRAKNIPKGTSFLSSN